MSCQGPETIGALRSYSTGKLSSGAVMSDTFAYQVDHGDASPVDRRRTSTRAHLLEGVLQSCPALSRSQARDVFEMALEEMSDALVRGEAVKLRSFGLFSVREKRERIGRNPRTGIEVPIARRRVLTFRPSPVLLDQVNGADPDQSESGAKAGDRQ